MKLTGNAPGFLSGGSDVNGVATVFSENVIKQLFSTDTNLELLYGGSSVELVVFKPDEITFKIGDEMHTQLSGGARQKKTKKKFLRKRNTNIRK